MVTLPLEVLYEISNYAQKSEQRILRRVCPSLAHYLIPQVFEAVNFRIWIDCAEELFHLSQNKHIAPHIKHLNCSFGYPSTLAITTEWDYLLELWNYTQKGDTCISPPSPVASDTMRMLLPDKVGVWRIKDMTVEQLEAAYIEYRKRSSFQASNISGIHVRGLAQALSSLPNLQSFTLHSPSNQVPWTKLPQETERAKERSTRMLMAVLGKLPYQESGYCIAS
jgi:hypothetical protein